MEITGLDQIDNRIIELLRNNARLSYSEIGKIVGLSRVTVKRRIEQLEKSGIGANKYCNSKQTEIYYGITIIGRIWSHKHGIIIQITKK